MIFVALGANLPSRFGEPAATLQAAVHALGGKGVSVQAASRVYLTAPVPVSDDPWYHNQVVAVATDKAPEVLLETLHAVENDFGRVRTVVNAPRLLDLDLIAYHDMVIEDDTLVVPHPRMRERAFVLYPLRELVADWVHPVTRQSIDELIAQLDPQQAFSVLSHDT